MKINKFKVGDKVIMPKLVDDKNSFATIGYQKKMFGKDFINQPQVVDIVGYFEGEYVLGFQPSSGWMPERFFEKFIEPKYKVGYKFINGNDWNMEIVKIALNKIKKEIYYLCFDLKDGYAITMSESQMRLTKPFIEIKPIEMTVEEISKKLGFKVVIKK